MATVGEGETDVSEIPLFVRRFFEEFDPHIGYSHGKTVIEADASFRDWAAKSGHSRNVFGDCDGVRVYKCGSAGWPT